MPVERVAATPAAEAVLRKLGTAHGPLLFHQSGGCCDGSAPMCYPRAEFRIGARDVYLGSVAGVPFYIGAQQFEYWQHTHLTIDVVPGRGSGFSLEAPEGVRFLTRSRLFTDDEWHALQSEQPPARGPEAAALGDTGESLQRALGNC
ncbi:MAG TPA: DUF779 domain-containing protein [Gemmatimonadaceae bacterium]|nr:DUF779 domain-containing protein [Gemmatimonadaceae bacterium]